MVIPIKTKPEDYFKNLLVVLHPVFKLKPREIEGMSSLLGLHYSNKDKVLEEKLDKLMFSSPVRKTIRKSLTPMMSENSYNNHIGQLRKKGLLSGNKINESLYKLYPTKEKTEIQYSISIDAS